MLALAWISVFLLVRVGVYGAVLAPSNDIAMVKVAYLRRYDWLLLPSTLGVVLAAFLNDLPCAAMPQWVPHIGRRGQ